MKAFIFIAALLTAAEAVLAKDLVAVEAPADTWCITYESTYLAAVTNQADLLPSDDSGNDEPDAQNSGRLPFAPSFHPTFRRNTSISITRSAMSTHVQDTLGPESSLFTSEVISTVDMSPVNSESSDLEVDRTAAQSSYGDSTATDGLFTTAISTVDTEATPTSTDIIEPAGRNVIFLIQTTDNEKRAIYRREVGGFIGINNPSVCTFAATFNIAEGQLFTDGVPIYYFGEDYKELSAQGRPPGGSVTSGFADSNSKLTFRNSELPNGEAGFCQDTEGQVYITFTTGPSGCVPVDLVAYNVEQCQDGRLIGLDELTSSVSGTAITTAVQSFSTLSTFGELSESTDLVPSQSNIPSSQTTEFETSAANLSRATESSTQESENANTQETSALTVKEDLETLSSVLTTSDDATSEPTAPSTPQLSSETSDLLDSTTTYSDGTGLSMTSGVESQTTTEIETSDIETTVKTSVSETTIILETTEATTTEGDTSSTEVISDIDTTAATDITDTTTTNGDVITESEDSTTMEAETTTTEATIEPEDLTTTEAETTTAEITTTAELTTTTEAAPEPQPQFACGDPGYTTTYTYNGVTFELQCKRGFSYYGLENVFTESFGECLRRCALNRDCNGIVWEREFLSCSLTTSVTAIGSFDEYDVAPVVSRS